MEYFLNIFQRNAIIKLLIAFFIGSSSLYLYLNYKELNFFAVITFMSYGFIALFTLIGIIFAWILNPLGFNNRFITILSGNHYPSIFDIGIHPIVYLFKNEFKKSIKLKFTNDSVFIFNGSDIFDWSKLCGLSFGNHQLNNSFRFGFRFLNDEEFEICEYNYINGDRQINKINQKLNLFINYNFEIVYNKLNNTITYNIIQFENLDPILDILIYSNTINVLNLKKYGYSLGLYLGGNNTINKDIKFIKQ